MAGKPYRPLLDDTVSRLALITHCSSATGLTPILQERLTPVSTACWCSPAPIALRSCSTPQPERPTFVGQDLRALLRPALVVRQSGGEFHCGQASASAVEGQLVVQHNGSSDVEAIWAAAGATWWAADHGLVIDSRNAVRQLVGNDHLE